MSKHGIYINQQPTSLQTPRSGISGLPVVVAASPIQQITAGKINVPVLCATLDEFKAAFGWSTDWDKYPACKAAYFLFAIAKVGPVVFINPLDPAAHGTDGTTTASLVSGTYTLTVAELVKSSLVVKSSDGVTTYELGTHYTAAYNTDCSAIVITRVGTTIAANASLKYEYKTIGNDALEAADVVDGVAALADVYAITHQIPGQLLAPGWSGNTTVGVAMVSAVQDIDGIWNCIALTDIPTDTGEATTYAEAISWVTDNSYVSEKQINCWPLSTLGNDVYEMSLQVAAMNIYLAIDKYNDVPVASPSNNAAWADGACLVDGTDVNLRLTQANLVNDGGIVTLANFARGWVLWGNSTGALAAGSTDPKDYSIPIQRMFIWAGNTLVNSFWANLDLPLNARLIDTIVTSTNQWLNGLASSGYIIGGSVEFRQADNPNTSLLGGHLVLHLSMAPPPAMQSLTFDIEYDVAALANLFGGE